jgi:hypothetical protein
LTYIYQRVTLHILVFHPASYQRALSRSSRSIQIFKAYVMAYKNELCLSESLK